MLNMVDQGFLDGQKRARKIAYAKKRIATLEERIELCLRAQPHAEIHNRPAPDRLRLDRLALKRWQRELDQ